MEVSERSKSVMSTTVRLCGVRENKEKLDVAPSYARVLVFEDGSANFCCAFCCLVTPHM